MVDQQLCAWYIVGMCQPFWIQVAFNNLLLQSSKYTPMQLKLLPWDGLCQKMQLIFIWLHALRNYLFIINAYLNANS